MIGPTLPLAAMVLMMWIIWSDSIRPQRPNRLIYAIRAVMFAGVIGVMIYNLVVYPDLFTPQTRGLTIFACIIGVIGMVYLVMKARKRNAGGPPAA